MVPSRSAAMVHSSPSLRAHLIERLAGLNLAPVVAGLFAATSRATGLLPAIPRAAGLLPAIPRAAGLFAPGLLAAILIAGALASPAAAQDAFAPATRSVLSGDYETARGEYLAYADAHPDDRLAPLALLSAARLSLESLEEPAEAEAACDRILEAYPASRWAAEAARVKGASQEAREAWSAAGDSYQRALELAAADSTYDAGWISEVSRFAADCFYRQGDRKRVMRMYERVLAAGESLGGEATAATRARLAECYAEAGLEDEAAEQYAHILTEHPMRPEFAEALSHRELIEQYETFDWDALEACGAVREAFQTGDFARAQSLCERALEGQLDPGLALAMEIERTFAELLSTQDFGGGLRKMRALRHQQESGYDHPQLDRRIDFLQTIADLERRTRRPDAEAGTWMDLGAHYAQARALEKSAEAYRQAVALDPENAQAVMFLGNTLARLGQIEEAASVYESFLAKEPDNTNALNQIGYVYLNQGHHEEALRYFQRYVEAAPDEANAHDSYGEGLLRAGRLEEARREYERAVEINPSFANSYFMLGEVYRQLALPEEAQAAYERFIELAPGDPRVEPARQAVEDLEQDPS